MEEKIRDLIENGELVTTELKEAKEKLPKNLFETICAFLNTMGGYIILGVNDKKEIVGVNPKYINILKKDFANGCNNDK